MDEKVHKRLNKADAVLSDYSVRHASYTAAKDADGGDTKVGQRTGRQLESTEQALLSEAKALLDCISELNASIADAAKNLTVLDAAAEKSTQLGGKDHLSGAQREQGTELALLTGLRVEVRNKILELVYALEVAPELPVFADRQRRQLYHETPFSRGDQLGDMRAGAVDDLLDFGD